MAKQFSDEGLFQHVPTAEEVSALPKTLSRKAGQVLESAEWFS
jgi:hypothetical protein